MVAERNAGQQEIQKMKEYAKDQHVLFWIFVTDTFGEQRKEAHRRKYLYQVQMISTQYERFASECTCSTVTMFRQDINVS